MTFRYEGFTKSGKAKKGQLEAGSIEDANQRVREAGLYVNRMEPVDGNHMKTILHHEPEEEFLDTADGPVIYSPSEGQNYPEPAPAWQPTWRKPQGVAKAKDDTQQKSAAPGPAEPAPSGARAIPHGAEPGSAWSRAWMCRCSKTSIEGVWSPLYFDLLAIAEFYAGALPAAGDSYAGVLSGDMMKPALGKVVEGLTQDAFRRAYESLLALRAKERQEEEASLLVASKRARHAEFVAKTRTSGRKQAKR